jgi:hypothetical protein
MKRFLLSLLLLLLVLVGVSQAIDIDQDWYDAGDHSLSVKNTTYRMTSNITAAKWGLVVRDTGITLDMNGYTLTYDTITCPTVANFSFETANSGDTSQALNWNYTNATSTSRIHGHYSFIETPFSRANLWSGNYSTRMIVPISGSPRDQVLKTSSAYAFKPGVHYAVRVQGYNINQAAADSTQLGIGLLNAAGDTVSYGRYYYWGDYPRGFLPIICDYYNTGLVDSSLYIFIKTYSKNITVPDTVYFDDVVISTYGYNGITSPLLAAYPGPHMSSAAHVGVNCHWTDSRDYPFADHVTQNFTVKNGTIQNGNGHSFAGYGILSFSARDTIDNVTMYTTGDMACNYLSENWTDSEIKNCHLYVYNRVGGHRDDHTNANIHVSSSNQGAGSYNSRVHDNWMWGSSHMGIVICTKCDTLDNGVKAYEENKCYNNTIYINSYYTNGFGIMNYGACGTQIYHNWIRTDSTGCSGSGIYLGNPSRVLNGHAIGGDQVYRLDSNTVVVQNRNPWQEYEEPPGVYGIQTEGGWRIDIHDNSITAFSNDTSGIHLGQFTPVYTSQSSMAYRCNFWGDDYGVYVAHNLHIRDNTFRGFSSTATDLATPFHFGPSEEWHYTPSDSVYIDSNTCISNGGWIKDLGSAYTGFSKGITFRSTTFQVDSTVVNGGLHYTMLSPFESIIGHPSYWGWVDSLCLIDNKFPDLATANRLKNSFMYQSANYGLADTETEWYYGWTVSGNTKKSGSNVSDVIVNYLNSLGDTVACDTTDASGNFSREVYEFRDSAQTTTYLASRDRTQYNPYHIIARKSVVGADDTVLTVDQKLNVNLVLSNQNPPSTPLLCCPATDTSTVSVTPTLKTNNSTDLDGDALTYEFTIATDSSFATIKVIQTATVAQGYLTTSYQATTLPIAKYYWRVRAFDGVLWSSYSLKRSINIVGGKPVFDALSSIYTAEQVPLTFNLHAVDYQGDPITLSARRLPTGSAFTDLGSGSGRFSWTPSTSQAGVHDTTYFIASDGTFSDTLHCLIRVVDNNATVWYTKTDSLGTNGPQESYIRGYSAQQDAPTGTYSSASVGDNSGYYKTLLNFPGLAGILTAHSGAKILSARIGWRLYSEYSGSGTEVVKVYAVKKRAVENELTWLRRTTDTLWTTAGILSSVDRFTDPETPTDSMYYTTTANCTVGYNCGTAHYNPTSYGDTSWFVLNPDHLVYGSWLLETSKTGGFVTYRCKEWGIWQWTPRVYLSGINNTIPVLTAVGSQSASTGTVFSLRVNGTDGDGITPALVASGLPPGATFVDSLGGYGRFTFTPTVDSTYTVLVYTTDGIQSDSELVSIVSTTTTPPEPGLEVLRPNAAGYSTTWTAYPANDNYTRVDEVEADDADYVYKDAASGNDSYNLSASALGDTVSISKVTVWVRVKDEGQGSRIRTILRLNSTNSFSSYIRLTSSYGDSSVDYLTKPGGGNWVSTDLADLIAGVNCFDAVDAKVYVSQLWVVVHYSLITNSGTYARRRLVVVKGDN